MAAAALVCLGLLGASWGSTTSAARTRESTSRQARAEPRSAGGIATGKKRRALAARYLRIARAGNRALDQSLGLLEGRDKNRLGPARADLERAVTEERTFDRRLLKIPFPPRTEEVAMTLYRVNQARAKLAVAAARSTSLGELHAYETRLDDANKPVERAVRKIRRQLGLPPPPSS